MAYDGITKEGGVPDIQLLDRIVSRMGSTDLAEAREATRIVEAFTSRRDLMSLTQPILASPCSEQTKFQFLRGLAAFIEHCWKTVPDDLQESFKGLIMAFNRNCVERGSALLADRCAQIYVEIATFEWPGNWLNLVAVLVKMAKESSRMCHNSLHVLDLLAQRIVSAEKDYITSNRAGEMRSQFQVEYPKIFEAIESALKIGDDSLTKVALDLICHCVPVVDTKVLFNGNFMQRVVVS